ncbi:MAG: hypothetical protein ACI8XG_002409, partial [Congregibacter sp.]
MNIFRLDNIQLRNNKGIKIKIKIKTNLLIGT